MNAETAVRTLPAVFALWLTCGAAEASDWVPLGTDVKSAETLVDVSSIRIAGEIRRVWWKIVFVPHTERGNGDDASKWLSFALYRHAFDCANESARNEAFTFYYDDETSYSNPANRYPQPWQQVPPDTTLEGVMKFVCAWREGKP